MTTATRSREGDLPKPSTSGAAGSFFNAAHYRRLTPVAYPRLIRVARALAHAGWGHYADRIHWPRGAEPGASAGALATVDAQRLRETLEMLGPTFVKFGQLLSLRRDLLTDAYIEELTKLQDQVPVDAQSEPRVVIQAELGKPVDDLYAAFDDVPLAAASMAQVYTATLPDGGAVVVKVQRTGIEETIHTDLAIMFFFARQLERRVAQSRRFSPLALVAEFAETIMAELDFRREGRNADRFRENFKDDPSVSVPRIFWTLSTARILTMERSPGHRAHEYETYESDAGRHFADNLIRSFLTQVFEHGFFHGDPHPGNVFLLDNGRLCFHDFGIVGTLAGDDQENLAQLIFGVAGRDPQWVADSYFAMGVAGPDVDRPAFTRDVADALAAFYDSAGHGPAFSEILRQFIRLGQRHQIRLPRAFLLVSKAFMEIESQALQLDPGFNIMTSIQDYAPRLVKRLMLPRFSATAVTRGSYRALRAARAAVDALPDIANRLVESLRDGKLSISLRHEQLSGMEDRIERASNRLSFSMIIASIVVASAVVMAFHAGPHYEGLPLLGLAGFVIAGLLGVGWAVAVLRSGRL
jgi:ubiquinone biosynthesis protein